MTRPTDQAADLYGAMPFLIPSVEEGDGSALRGDGADPGRPNRNPMIIYGDLQRQEVRQLTSIGLAYYAEGELEKALEPYRRVLEIKADHSGSLYSLGVILGQLGRYQESRVAFEQLARSLEALGSVVNPTILAVAYQGIGAALLGLCGAGPEEPLPSVAKEIETAFRQAVALDPNSVRAWAGLGVVFHIQKRLGDSEEAFRRALEIDPKNQPAAERLRGVLEDKLERRLFDLGYLAKVNEPIWDLSPYENRTLIEVDGEPLSQVIIEERR